MCILIATFSCKKDTESTAVSITDFTPKQGYAGDNIIITGKNFKQTQKVETIITEFSINIPIISWEKNKITCIMPTAQVSYNEDLTQIIYGKWINIYLNDGGRRTMIGRFEYITPTYISISDTLGLAYDTISIKGSNISNNMEDVGIFLHDPRTTSQAGSGIKENVISVLNGEIKLVLPYYSPFSPQNPLIEIRSKQISTFVRNAFKYARAFDFSPKTGKVGDQVVFVVNNNNFNNIFKFNSIPATVQWNWLVSDDSTEVAVKVPAGLKPGVVKITGTYPNGYLLPSHSSDFLVTE